MSFNFPGLQDLVDRELGGRRVRLLEAGCGSASRLNFGPDVWVAGIDISKKQLDRNRFLNEKVLGDIQRYEFPRDSFDAVICWDVLEHLPEPKAALRNFALATRPGGIVILKLPNVLSLKGLVTKFFPHHIHVLAYRYFHGDLDAGKEDTVPFKTFLRFSIASKAIQRFFADYGLKPLLCSSADVASTDWLQSRKAALYPYIALKRALHLLSFGILGDSDFVLVLKKLNTTAPALPFLPTISYKPHYEQTDTRI